MTTYRDFYGPEILLPPMSLSIQQTQMAEDDSMEQAQASGGEGGEPDAPDEPAGSNNRYVLSPSVWEELLASAKAGLTLPAVEFANDPASLKSHLVLQYPGPDGIVFLDAVVQKLAQHFKADLVTLDAQDISQLCSDQDRTENGGVISSNWPMSYDVFRQTSTWIESDEKVNDREEDEEDVDASSASPPSFSTASPKFIAIEGNRGLEDARFPALSGFKLLLTSLNDPSNDISWPNPASSMNSSDPSRHHWSRLLIELVSPKKDAVQASKAISPSPGPELTDMSEPDPLVPVIVQIQDYRDIQSTKEGSKFISLLHQVIRNRRREGFPVLLIGTVSKETLAHDVSLRFMSSLEDSFSRTMAITPAMSKAAVDQVFREDFRNRIKEINIRHLQDMIRTRLNGSVDLAHSIILRRRSWALDPTIVKESSIDERYWTYSYVHRVATLVIGSVESNEALNLGHIERGIKLIQKSDRVLSDWMQINKPRPDSSAVRSRENKWKKTLAGLQKSCNTHEKKLLNGVVDAGNIRTTFADVHVPSETIEALKTLTSLSLIRPEAFTYGVLATDKIPGLLLYGPPGTGKTLLAKAVARESGATVLEVSGSEVYDMYVGEGEKNVKAIFTLAKKLSPCVVFIDEADAIFCSRTGASNRTSHRELINQFLREWDGMNDMSAFIMVATNRPFDLDDAVLRRLPRRLLVDLPTENDRESILRIQLKDEIIDPGVDLTTLAHRTPFYSGSDLKNLCVSAALACVRDENERAAQHRPDSDQQYEYPERRILTQAHFDRAMEEISASISEDMSSLTAIRKFDEKYGDQKSRRKKGAGWGFTPTRGNDTIEADTVRVRK